MLVFVGIQRLVRGIHETGSAVPLFLCSFGKCRKTKSSPESPTPLTLDLENERPRGHLGVTGAVVVGRLSTPDVQAARVQTQP